MDYTFSPGEILTMVTIGRRAGLSGMSLISADIDRAQRICNGIGASWMPNWSRHLIGEIFPHLIVISLSHDLKYWLGGGIWARWVADWEFLMDGFRMAWFNRGGETNWRYLLKDAIDIFRDYSGIFFWKNALIFVLNRMFGAEVVKIAFKAFVLWIFLRVFGAAAFNWKKQSAGRAGNVDGK